MAKKIVVQLGERSYPIFITRKAFRPLGPLLKKINLGKDLFVVSTPKVKSLYGASLQKSLTHSGLRIHFTRQKFPQGARSEKAKSHDYAHRLVRELVRYSKGGKQFVLASFSGGVLGDLTGYVASVYKRGIPYLQIPTTLLAQVDSSIGGKVGIDLPEGKNLLGSIYQPRLVYASLSVLGGLRTETLRDGLAEVVKYGVIADPSLFSYLEKNFKRLLGKKPDLQALEHIVWSCAKIKASIVSQDERDEKGVRALLNFGHTLGHALEQAKGYRISHGKAISFGMVCAGEIAFRLGLFSEKNLGRLESLLLTLRLPTRISGVSVGQILRAESHDKKFIHGRNRYVLPTRIGKAVLREGVSYRLIRKVLSERLV